METDLRLRQGFSIFGRNVILSEDLSLREAQRRSNLLLSAIGDCFAVLAMTMPKPISPQSRDSGKVLLLRPENPALLCRGVRDIIRLV